MNKKGKATSADKSIGLRLKQIRTLNGMSQSDLGEKLGMTFQQVQKYETGTNRIAASRIPVLAKIFKVPTDYFYGGGNGFEEPTELLLDKHSTKILSLVSRMNEYNKETILTLAKRLA